MHFVMTDLYRAPVGGSPTDAIRVTPRLGAVWFAGADRVLAPSPARVDAPWCQIGVVPAHLTDGVEGRLVVADAELARHGLAWLMDAPENRDNVFVRAAHAWHAVRRVDALWPGRTVLVAGVVRHPLRAPVFEPRGVVVDGGPLGGLVLEGALTELQAA